MDITDIHALIYAFVGIMIAEVVIKPIAIRLGRYLIKKLDDRILVIPDWLSHQGRFKPKNRSHHCESDGHD